MNWRTIPLLVLGWGIPCLAQIPYPAALDAAAVEQSRITDLNREALMLGNGDLIALLWEQNGGICLRVTKSDIWDARVDTSQDNPLMKVDLLNQKWSGGGYPPSWKKPYPAPRCAAIVRIGGNSGQAGAWRCIRSGGKVNEWGQRENLGVMAIEGNAGASAGYRWDLDAPQVAAFNALKVQLSGTPGARFYINIFGATRKEIVATGWRDSPQDVQELAFPIPAGDTVTGVELYVMTRDGARVENRVRRIIFEGAGQPLVIPPGMAGAVAKSARLDLRRAVARVDDMTVRAVANRNVLLVETDKTIALEEIKSKTLPAAETGQAGGIKWLHMKMPGDVDYAGMEYAFAVAGNGRHQAVAVMTSFDTTENVRDAAIRLARTTVAGDPAALVAQHEEEWSRYWSASGVQLDDPDFQLWWYRMVYYLRCMTRPGAQAIGLFAGMATDSPPWHGDYHHNYNAWQPYWTPFVVNHPELAEPWVRYMNQMLPRLKWLARTTYDCDGAFVGISSFAFEPDPANCKSVNRRQIAIPPYGYTMGMMGMSAQVLWLSHLYRPDRQYLADQIYPVLREAALFYCSFTDKCPRDANGKAKLGPSYSPEHGGFGVANVPFDIAYARLMLQAASSAAGELDRDRDLVDRFRKAIDLLPPYPTAPDAGGRPIVVDWTGCKFREIREHNITVPAVPVFPADQVTWFSPDEETDLFRNTIRQTRHRGCNSTVILTVAKARFSMPEAIDDLRNYYKPTAQPNGMFFWPMHGYYLSESVGIAAAISEFLLQSVGNTIRVFPCWPKERDASFSNLRAQGGFLVSAEQKGGAVTKLEITSTVGGRLRLIDPWSGRVNEMQTKAGETLRFTKH